MSNQWVSPLVLDMSRLIPDEGKLVWTYLSINRQAQVVPGLLAMGPSAIAENWHLRRETVVLGLDQLMKGGLIEYDETGPLIRIPAAPQLLSKVGVNGIKGWWRHWLTMPESPLKYVHIESLQEAASDPTNASTWEVTFGKIQASRSSGLTQSGKVSHSGLPQLQLALLTHDSLSSVPIPVSDHALTTLSGASSHLPKISENFVEDPKDVDGDVDKDKDVNRSGDRELGQSGVPQSGAPTLSLALGSGPKVQEPAPAPPPPPPRTTSRKKIPKAELRKHLLAKHRAAAERLWDLQNELRRDAIPGALMLKPQPDLLAHVAARIEEYGEVEAERALRWRAQSAKIGGEKDAQYFNGSTNWRKNPFHYAIGKLRESTSPPVRERRVGNSAPAPASAFTVGGDRKL